MLHASAESWTRGHLEGFLDDYDPEATFVGSSGLMEGRDRIRRAYEAGYWASGMPAQGLRFRLLKVRTAGEDAAVAVGRYELFDRDTSETGASGLFSLTLRRTADGWKIVHDHSSADPSG
jgi:beta-aspartyl-peptidase (threonine type)